MPKKLKSKYKEQKVWGIVWEKNNMLLSTDHKAKLYIKKLSAEHYASNINFVDNDVKVVPYKLIPLK